MSQYQRIFLIADSSMKHSAAMKRAAALAKASGASLHVGLFLEPIRLFGVQDEHTRESMREGYRKEQTLWLEDEVRGVQSQGVTVTTEVVWARDTLREILTHADEMQADLIIKDLRHESALKRVFITPMDCQLLRDCRVPLHLVAEAKNAMPRKIVAAVDVAQPELQISGLNARILDTAITMALQCGAELNLLHVCDLAQAYVYDAVSGGTVGWTSAFAEELRAALEQAFATVADNYGVPVERRHLLLGGAASRVGEFAMDKQMDVVVMGTVHRKGLNKLIGSTTENVLYRVPGSVLAIGMDKQA